ncbi:biotin synthase BioB [Candidatus Marinamargulisbacteria bacterium SCGC AAA071-K20]|nr:biotin synthase BioB [Candidatus Marinamargulisbacteria bacterium SCGC AAA071-K20]
MTEVKTEKVTLDRVKELYSKPFLDLVYEAASVHRKHHDASEVQLCTLLSVKTGGCSEDCSYCPQAARYHTDVEKQKLMDVGAVLSEANKAKESGSTRFCMGAAWREVKDNEDFDNIIKMVKGVSDLGLEACCTLGMLTKSQADKLADAGLTAYNHNLDSSDGFYSEIITTRTYQDRLNTLKNVADAGISTCCGGIIGMGETEDDRIKFLHTLANLDTVPESVPINALVPVEGTPLENQKMVDPFDWIRVIAIARIVMPEAMVRLSAGRLQLSKEVQAFAFMAGANSIFTGEKLLTTGNPDYEFDTKMLGTLGLKGRVSNKKIRINA